MLLAFAQSALPGDCLLTGFCQASDIARPVASGVMFLASGLIAIGIIGLRSRRKRSRAR
jgi:hypothetical protein